MRRSSRLRAGALALGMLVVGSAGCSAAAVAGDDGEPAPISNTARKPDSPNPVASPPTVERTPDPRVGTALFDADVSVPGVYVAAIAEEDSTVRVLYHAASSRAEEFRAFVDARTGDSTVLWEDSGYSPMDQQATGSAIVDEAQEKGLSPSGGFFDRDTFEFVVFVTKEPTSEPVFINRYLAGREVAVRVEVSPEDGLQ